MEENIINKGVQIAKGLANEARIRAAYEIAKDRYAAIGVDTDKAVETLEKTPISLHCWQTDDVMGFESNAPQASPAASRPPATIPEGPAI